MYGWLTWLFSSVTIGLSFTLGQDENRQGASEAKVYLQ